jgi:hypothetical protein
MTRRDLARFPGHEQTSGPPRRGVRDGPAQAQGRGEALCRTQKEFAPKKAASGWCDNSSGWTDLAAVSIKRRSGKLVAWKLRPGKVATGRPAAQALSHHITSHHITSYCTGCSGAAIGPAPVIGMPNARDGCRSYLARPTPRPDVSRSASAVTSIDTTSAGSSHTTAACQSITSHPTFPNSRSCRSRQPPRATRE